MDVKVGSGAFMTSLADARELAAAIVEVAVGAGTPTAALITDMDQVLGTTAGNALEVAEAVAYLEGGPRDPRLDEVTQALCASLLVQGGLQPDEDAARAAVQHALDSGAAADRWHAMVRALGGPRDILGSLPVAPFVRAVEPVRAGVVTGMDTRAVGLVVTGLGGNRRREDDVIDPAVGLTEIAPVGAAVAFDRPLAVVHARDEAGWEGAAIALRAAVQVGDAGPDPRPVVLEAVGR
jgi:thymidine phosphorylase